MELESKCDKCFSLLRESVDCENSAGLQYVRRMLLEDSDVLVLPTVKRRFKKHL